MPKSKSARVSRRDRNGKRRTTPELEEPVYGIHVPEALHEAIENERGTLAQAVSILRCLAISLESDMPSPNGPYYPDVAEIAYTLVTQALNGLDSLNLRNCVMRDRNIGKDAPSPTPV
jgi:hypothetical protein